MILNNKHVRTYRLNRLYFRYLQTTEHERHWDLKDFADALEVLGYIALDERRTRYAETEKFKNINTRDTFWTVVGPKLSK